MESVTALGRPRRFEGGLISSTRRMRVKTTAMCGLITADSVRQSHSNYALIILRELRSRRTLWNRVYPAAE